MEGTYINIVGNNKEEIAEAIADYYDSKVVKDGDTVSVLVNSDIEADFCITEDLLLNAISAVNQSRPGLNITLENIEF